MPAPVAYIVVAGITAVAAGIVFIRYVYEPHVAPVLERLAEDFLERRRAQSRHLASPVGASGSGGGDIPLNETSERRPRPRSRSSDSTAPLILRVPPPPFVGPDAQTWTTARDSDLSGGVRRRLVATPDIVEATKDGEGEGATSTTLGGLSPREVNEWRNKVGQHTLRKRRTAPSPLSVEIISPIPPPAAISPAHLNANVSHVLDEPNDSLPQTPIYPTHVITDSSVPSSPSSIVSSPARKLDSLSPRMSPLRSPNKTSSISDIIDQTSSTSRTAAPLTLDPHPNPWSSGTPNVMPLSRENSTVEPNLASPTLSSHSQPLSVVAIQQQTNLASPRSPASPPYLLTPSAQHPHHVHYPAPPNISNAKDTGTTGALSSDEVVVVEVTPATPPSLSQSYPVSLDQEHGIELVSNPSAPSSEFEFDPLELNNAPTTTAPGSPFISLSPPVLNLAMAARSAGSENEALVVPASATTIRQQSLHDAMQQRSRGTTTLESPPSPSSPNMFYSFTYDAQARLSPDSRMQSSVLSFPDVLNASRTEVNQQRLASPGVLSPMLSELDFVSDFGGSDDDRGSHFGSNDEIRSESSWASARF